VEHVGDIADALQQRLSVCLRCDRSVCNRGFCIHHCKVHLPFFLLQFDIPGGALNEVHTKQEPDSWEHIPKRPRLGDHSETPETGISESESSDWIPPPPPLPGFKADGSRTSPDLDSTKVRLFNRHIGHLSLGQGIQGIQDALLPQQPQPFPPALRPPRPTSAAGAAFAANTVRNVLSNPGRRSNRKHPEEKAEFPPKPAPEAESPRIKPSCAVPGHRPVGPEPEASPKLAVNLVSRKVVQSRGRGVRDQASVAMKAKVDELKAWQHYLEARERFMSLCEEIPTPSDEESKEGEGREVHWQSS